MESGREILGMRRRPTASCFLLTPPRHASIRLAGSGRRRMLCAGASRLRPRHKYRREYMTSATSADMHMTISIVLCYACLRARAWRVQQAPPHTHTHTHAHSSANHTAMPARRLHEGKHTTRLAVEGSKERLAAGQGYSTATAAPLACPATPPHTEHAACVRLLPLHASPRIARRQMPRLHLRARATLVPLKGTCSAGFI